MSFAIPDLATAFMLTFARVGTLVDAACPGIGEQLITPRARLAFALLLSLVLFPLTRTHPARGRRAGAVIGVLIGEIAVGLLIGLAVRMIVGALQTAGTDRGAATRARLRDDGRSGHGRPAGGDRQPPDPSRHHADLRRRPAPSRDRGDPRLATSCCRPGGVPSTGDAAALAIRAAAQGFALAVQISAPFIAFAILFNLGLGVLSRLMPQLQVFFLAMPATILVGMLVLLATLGVMMGVFVEDLGAFLQTFVRR